MRITAGTLADRLMYRTISMSRLVGGASVLIGIVSYVVGALFGDEHNRQGIGAMEQLRMAACLVVAGAIYFAGAHFLLGRRVTAVIAVIGLAASHAVPTLLYMAMFAREFWPLACFLMLLLGGILATLVLGVQLLIATISQSRLEARSTVITIPRAMLYGDSASARPVAQAAQSSAVPVAAETTRAG